MGALQGSSPLQSMPDFVQCIFDDLESGAAGPWPSDSRLAHTQGGDELPTSLTLALRESGPERVTGPISLHLHSTPPAARLRHAVTSTSTATRDYARRCYSDLKPSSHKPRNLHSSRDRSAGPVDGIPPPPQDINSRVQSQPTQSFHSSNPTDSRNMRPRRSSRRRKQPPCVAPVADLDVNSDWAPLVQFKTKRPAGRPIIYKGDPDSPALTEHERRQVKRRIANRESAKRIRQRKQGESFDLREQLHESRERASALMERIQASEHVTQSLYHQVEVMRAQLQAARLAQHAAGQYQHAKR